MGLLTVFLVCAAVFIRAAWGLVHVALGTRRGSRCANCSGCDAKVTKGKEKCARQTGR